MRLFSVALVLLTLILTPVAGSGQQAMAASVSEYRLAGFQAAALDRDLPVVDAVLEGTTTLWLLGKQSLWSWRLADGHLARIALPHGDWQRLFYDGLSIYAGGSSKVFQLQIAQKRLFSYEIKVPAGGDTLGFGGDGDDLWLLHEKALLKIDRYGKSLAAKFPGSGLKKDDLVAFDAPRQVLWIARGKQLLRVDFHASGGGRQKVVLTAKHKFDGVAVADDQVILHTEHSVLRLDAASSKTLKSIPVEGGRKLLAMAIGKLGHAYAFDDHLLELFDLNRRVARSFRLPLEPEDHVARLVTAGDTAAILVGGKPRAYRLGE